MVVLIDDSDILVEAEDRTGQQERLRHVVKQARRHIVDLDYLIRYQRDAAHDEQHRTGILRDFEALVVFHGLHGCSAGSTEDEGDDVTDRLENCLDCLAHNF